MARIAILAFGSLIEDPGKELHPHIREHIEGIKTPFSIEFARSSSSRGGGPTLVPVNHGGSPVNAVLLALNPAVGISEARDENRVVRKAIRASGRPYGAERELAEQADFLLSLVSRSFCPEIGTDTDELVSARIARWTFL